MRYRFTGAVMVLAMSAATLAALSEPARAQNTQQP
jgi:hypothetical protein